MGQGRNRLLCTNRLRILDTCSAPQRGSRTRSCACFPVSGRDVEDAWQRWPRCRRICIPHRYQPCPTVLQHRSAAMATAWRRAIGEQAHSPQIYLFMAVLIFGLRLQGFTTLPLGGATATFTFLFGKCSCGTFWKAFAHMVPSHHSPSGPLPVLGPNALPRCLGSVC